MESIEHWISNERVVGQVERLGNVHDPATGVVIAQVPFATVDEVDLAVAAAGDSRSSSSPPTSHTC